MTSPFSAPAPSRSIPALADQVVLVTGGARGLGRAITEALLGEGARVVVNHLTSGDAARDVAARHPGRAVAVRADVRDRDEVEALFEAALARVDAPISTVVTDAPSSSAFNGDARAKADARDYDAFSPQFSGPVQGALTPLQAALPGFARAGSGRVINVG